jgi:cellulose synthase/poly-beta-1,6-N-acetylglucosamine synthase-like glycosyltransferase
MNTTTLVFLLNSIVVYYVLLHGLYLVLILLGATQMRRYHLGIRVGDFRRIAESPLTLPFTVIIPAFNEEKVVVGTVEAALKLRYPQHEVIVVNDGSDDATLQVLIQHFGLRQVRKVGPGRLPTKAPRGHYECFEHPNLLVIDKPNGQRADAINAAANFARYPLLCIMDADCIFEEDALVRAVRPFLRSRNVIGAGGIVRPANGLRVRDGRIQEFGLPRRLLALVQSVEYLRSFQWARLGLARLNSMLSISGAFMVVRKDVFLEMGGVAADSITDDIEFTIRLYKYAYEHSGPERLVVDYSPDPVCYTEVPETWRAYIGQRNRWQRGTMQALFRHWRMTLNPRYGLAGLFGMPFFLVFEVFSALVEGLSYVLVFFAYAAGLATLPQVLVFVMLAMVLGTFLSLLAVLMQERTRMRVTSAADLLRLLGAAVLENFGYHQVHLLIRIVGTFDYLVRRRKDVGASERYGSYQEPAGPQRPLATGLAGAGSAGGGPV